MFDAGLDSNAGRGLHALNSVQSLGSFDSLAAERNVGPEARWLHAWCAAEGVTHAPPCGSPTTHAGGSSVWEPTRFANHVRSHVPATLHHGIARWLTDLACGLLRKHCLAWDPDVLLPELERIDWQGPMGQWEERLQVRGRRLRELIEREWPDWARHEAVRSLLDANPTAVHVSLAWRASRCALELAPSEARAALCAYAMAMLPSSRIAESPGAVAPSGLSILRPTTAVAIAWIEAFHGRWDAALASSKAAVRVAEGELSAWVLAWLSAVVNGDLDWAQVSSDALEGVVWPADPQWQRWLDLGGLWPATGGALAAHPSAQRWISSASRPARQLFASFFPRRDDA